MSDQQDAVFVTGGSRGIGRLIALHLARRRVPVGVMARPSPELDSVAEEAGGGTSLVGVPVDVADAVAVRSAFGAAVDVLGPPSALITCAGSMDALGPVAEVDPELWWRAVAVDLRGTMLAAQAALRWMLPARAGRIVTIYGNLGEQGHPNVSAFAVAKAGVARLTEVLANELAGSGVVVIGLHPGFVRTPMTERLAWSEEGRTWFPEFGARAEGRWGAGEDAIRAIDRILGGKADALAGRTIHATDASSGPILAAGSNPEAGRLRLRPR